MNLKGVGSSNIINLYSKNSAKSPEKVKSVENKDRIEISAVAKSLRAFDVAEVPTNNISKINELKEKISNGTYNIDAKLTAESIINHIKESRDNV